MRDVLSQQYVANSRPGTTDSEAQHRKLHTAGSRIKSPNVPSPGVKSPHVHIKSPDPNMKSPGVELGDRLPLTPPQMVDSVIEAINGWPQKPPSRAELVAYMKQSPPGFGGGEMLNISDDVKADYEQFYPWFPPAQQ